MKLTARLILFVSVAVTGCQGPPGKDSPGTFNRVVIRRPPSVDPGNRVPAVDVTTDTGAEAATAAPPPELGGGTPVVRGAFVFTTDGTRLIRREVASLGPNPTTLGVPIALFDGASGLGTPIVGDGVPGAAIIIPYETAWVCRLRGITEDGDSVFDVESGSPPCLPPAVSDGLWLLPGGADPVVRVLSPADGTPLASADLPEAAVQAAIALSDGRVAIPTVGGVHVVERQGTQIVVEAAALGGTLRITSLIEASSDLLVASATSDGPDDAGFGLWLLRFRFQDGELVPEAGIAMPSAMTSPPVAAIDCGQRASGGAHWWCGDGAIISGGAHWVIGVDATTGAERFRVNAEGVEVSGLALGEDGRIYSGGAHWLTGGGLAAINPRAGAPETITPLVSDLALSARGAPVLLCDGTLVARMEGGLVRVETGSAHAAGAWSGTRGDGNAGRRTPWPACAEAVPTAIQKACTPDAIWADLPPLTIARSYGCAAYLDGRVYALGGSHIPVLTPEAGVFYGATGAFEALDLQSGVWSVLPSATFASFGGCEAADGRVYVTARDGTDQTRIAFFDVRSASWREVASGPTTLRRFGHSVWHDGRLVTPGGVGGGYHASVDAFDPVSATSVPLGALSHPGYGVGGLSLGGELFALGGLEFTGLNQQTPVNHDEVWRLGEAGWQVIGSLVAATSALRPMVVGADVFVLDSGNQGLSRLVIPTAPEEVYTYETLPPAPSLLSESHFVTATPWGIVVGGGGGWNGPSLSDVHVYCRPGPVP